MTLSVALPLFLINDKIKPQNKDEEAEKRNRHIYMQKRAVENQGDVHGYDERHKGRICAQMHAVKRQ